MADAGGAGDTTTAAGPATLDEAVEWLRKHFRAEAAEGLRVSYALELGGPGGGPIRLVIADGRVDVDRTAEPGADVRLRLPASDYFAVLGGRANADLLYMEGRLEIEGDLALATRLRTLFRPRA
jgi:predicted lipid carrier protein YhbT